MPGVAAALSAAGAAVALASDANPGGGLSPSLPFAMTLACFGMGLSLEEALAGGETLLAVADVDWAQVASRSDAGGDVAPLLRDLPPGCAFHPRCPLAVARCRTERPELRDVAASTQAACHLA